MISTSSRERLPPPAVFTRDETLHAILLPPLAVFLSELSTPDQLIKLHDILNRFRTPKSYHRIDVRLVESSELPPDGHEETAAEEVVQTSEKVKRAGEDGKEEEIITAGAVGEAQTSQPPKPSTGSRKRKRDAGDPVILPEGMSMEEYLLANPRPPKTIGDDTSAPAVDSALPDGDEIDVRPPTKDSALPDGDEIDIPRPEPPSLTKAQHSTPSEPPKPAHELPPAAPTRRVRELRLDLRTLDAAALFHLETWRRQVLGLQELDLDHPDSIWYKNPTPPPSPPPAAIEPSQSKRKRGRPPKDRSQTVETTEATGTAEPTDPVGDDTGDMAKREDSAALMQASAAHADIEVQDGKERGKDNAPSSGDVVVEESGQMEHVKVEGPRTPLDSATAAEDTEEPRSPSPDIILDDLFDRREDEDPDFVPPPPRKQKAKRTRGAPANDVFDSSAFGDMDVIDLASIPEHKGSDPIVKTLEFVDITPKFLEPVEAPDTASHRTRSGRVATSQPKATKRKRSSLLEGVVVGTKRTRSSLSASASPMVNTSARKQRLVLNLSESPDTKEQGRSKSAKSVGFDTLGDAIGYSNAEEMFVLEGFGDDEDEADMTDQYGVERAKASGNSSVNAIADDGGNDEWDFLREL